MTTPKILFLSKTCFERNRNNEKILQNQLKKNNNVNGDNGNDFELY